MNDKTPHLYYYEETLQKSTDSEKAFLEIMKQKLDGDWFVFHSVRFTDKDPHDKRFEREIDFLLFNPIYGFLVVEVKGKRIACKDGKYSIDGRGCNPFAQARQSMFGFANLLKRRLSSGIPFRISFAAAFPFCRANDFEMPLEDKNALMDSVRLQNPEAWIKKRIREKAVIQAAQNATATIDDVLRILAPTSESEDDVGALLTYDEKEIERHSIDPAQFLSLFSAFPRLKVCGCAGSGKTLLAVEKARQMGERRKRTLVLCYNTLLAKTISNHFAQGTLPVTVKAFYDFGAETLKLPPESVAAHAKDPRAYAFISRELKKYLSSGGVKPYDAVIIDEGQDFTDEMWEIVKLLVTDDPVFYVFYDPGQNIFHTKMHLPDFGMPPVMLSVNCRNTRWIAEELSKYSPERIESKAGMPEGVPVRTIEGDCRENLEALLDKLVNRQNIARSSITIIGAHSLGHTSIGKDRTIAGVRISDGSEPSAVAYYTYMKFKGCDSKIVILLDVSGKDPRWDAVGMYTALSRAVSQAYILRKSDS